MESTLHNVAERAIETALYLPGCALEEFDKMVDPVFGHPSPVFYLALSGAVLLTGGILANKTWNLGK